MPQFTRPNGLLLLLGWIFILGVACTLSSNLLTPESETVSKLMTATSEIPQEPFSLPAPLYFLQAGQIWRLTPDLQAQQQITNEDAPINAFDIAPDDGKLVFVSNNSLIIIDSDGGNRKILRQGPVLVEVADELARLNDTDQITSAMRTPLWSSDGKQIAFIENGIQLFDLGTNQVEQIWSQSITSSEPYLFESLLSWSPDDNYLLVSQYAYPLQTQGKRWLSVLQLDGPLYMEIAPSTQSTFTWSPDMRFLVLANAALGTDRSLMRCEPETMQCSLIAEFEPARWYYHYAFPFVTLEERLLVFMGASNDPIVPPTTFNLISLSLDGYGRRNLRDDGYHLESALWSPLGDGVVVTLAQGAGVYPTGSTLWLSLKDQLPITLPIMDVSNLRWGSP